MRLLYTAETIEKELNAAIGNKKLSNWFWVYFLHEKTRFLTLEIAAAFFFRNRKRFKKLYMDNDNLFDVIKEGLSDCIIPDDVFYHAPYIPSKKVHPKVYFFGDNKELSECKKWVAFIGSHNVQFEERNGRIRIAAPMFFETMTKLTSEDDAEMLDELADYFRDLKNEVNATRRKKNKIRILPEPEDYQHFINKHEMRVIETLNARKNPGTFLRGWQLIKDRYLPTKVVTYKALGERYGLSRERIRQLIERTKKALITSRFTFLDSEKTEE